MHFERSLRRAIYPPWKDEYIDYGKLKNLLRDEGSEAGSVAGHDDEDKWTEQDEGAFVEELVNVQLEKVHNFQTSTIQKLNDRTSACEAKLDPILVKDSEGQPSGQAQVSSDAEGTLRQVMKELDSITKEMNELEKFSRINYTGFLKATKKHDRKRGHAYLVRPLMQVRLAALPFNKEDYSPLLFRLSTMYSFIRQNLEGGDASRTFSETRHGGVEEFTAYKFWVHPDNLLELRTVILRRLPVLIYNPQTSKVVQASQKDPTITSIYFDNPKFSLYNAKVDHTSAASSIRLRWYDQVSLNPEIFLEKKTVNPDETSQEQRFTTKPKYIKPFLRGEYKMEKDISRLKERFGDESEQVKSLQGTVSDIQTFIRENDLQPMVRANYVRTAFQIPGDRRVRVTLDTDLALIREDALDVDRPCRDPEDWHRRDIDDAEMEYPFSKIRKGEINRFPFALLEIRIQGDKQYEWVSDLMSSHLVKEAPKFSKFVHGVATLFDDYVNTLPFWLSEVESDIRKDPQQAFDEEQEKRAKAAEDEFAVGSLLKSRASPAHRPSIVSPVGSPASRGKSMSKSSEKATAQMTRTPAASFDPKQQPAIEEEDSDDADAAQAEDARGFRSFIPGLSTSKYAQSKRHGQVKLPPGVQEPTYWIKDEGPVRVEAKVWLANQRTFIKWQHVAILLASLSMGLYNAAGTDNNVARTLGIVYTVIAIFTSIWGWLMYTWRQNLIRKRSGKDFDNVLGPVVACVALIVALWVNFGLKYQIAIENRDGNVRLSDPGSSDLYMNAGEL